VLPLLAALALACPDSVRAVGPGDPPWVATVEHLGCERLRLADDLATARARLEDRADREDPAQRARLLPAPATPSGYGLLPSLTADAAPGPVPLQEVRYRVDDVATATTQERAAAARLLTASATDSAPLRTLVEEYRRLRDRLRWIESSVGYHRYWQRAADEHQAWFATKAPLVERAGMLRAMQREAWSAPHAPAFREALARDVAPFTPVPGLRVRRDPDGTRVLPLNITTDITDAAFLQALRAAVLAAWNASEAMVAADLRVDLRWHIVPPDRLYPEGPPTRGSAIDLTAHLTRFPPGVPVLTTGAASTHAMVGRAVQLGATSLGPRVLAHEIGHLLGFSDAYLRGVEGPAQAPLGRTIVEWTGLQDDLMGSPGAGCVTPAMVAQLLAAYGDAAPPPPR
jgi:hypothetical protein